MDLFGEQIEERRESDRHALEQSFQKIASVVLGEKTAQRLSDESIVAKQAVDEILKYYHLKPVEVPEEVTDTGEHLDYCLRRYGLMRRDIELKGKWYADAFGPVLAFKKEDGSPVALIPGSLHGYYYTDTVTATPIRLNSKTAKGFETEAICFYKPLPFKKLGVMDLMRYMRSCLNLSDLLWVVLATLLVTLTGLLIPRITAAVTGPILSNGNVGALLCAAVFIVCVALSCQLFGSVSALLSRRLQIKTSIGVESSMMMRILTLPVEFFRKQSPGELKSRAMSVNSLCDLLTDMIMNTGLTSLISLLNISQIFSFTPGLVFPALTIILITLAFSVVTTLAQARITRKLMEQKALESGLTYSVISGVQKIKLAGAEKRIFSRWLDLYSDGVRLQFDPPVFLKIAPVITQGINLFSTIVLYYMAVKTGVNQSSFFAFTAAYGSLMGAFMALSRIAMSAAKIGPILEMAKPFLDSVPEVSENREIVTSITGSVEIDHVSFRYDERSPYVLDDISLRVRPGEYLAIVGQTGCGKSTLIRLLLGFETPEKGAVYYDGKDLSSLDVGSLRRNIGTVTQDGVLFQGDIYSNITITAPQLTEEDAWEAAEKAMIADDIRKMPMGMNTFISEGQGGISGGQKQRLMIARAIAPKPKLLIFDEATSALDNKTQKQLIESLDTMGCTRIVVAHRLSTIRHCDRIIVLDGGHITEDGTYDELIAKNGFFARLVARQRLDIEDDQKD